MSSNETPLTAQAETAEQPVDSGYRQWPTLHEMADRYIRDVLEHANGNKSKAARILNVSRYTVYRWLKGARISSVRMLGNP